MEKFISIVIPNYNKADTIEKCLEAAFAVKYKNFEVIVVDDYSEDNSVELIKQYPCRLIQLNTKSGTSRARNIGAYHSKGEFIFFTDADCLLQEDTLSIINRTVSNLNPDVVIGGTYTRLPYDRDFFSTFQSVFINYSETKKAENPDYIAAHAMIINTETFKKSGGFPEDFMPIIEDVEFSHRLRRSGKRLIMNPEIQVQHIFNFSLWTSLRNAFKKTAYWCMYSMKNRDLLVDSGTASVELKTNVASYFLSIVFFVLWIVTQKFVIVYLLFFIFFINTLVSRRLLRAFYETKGILFMFQAFLYYTILYPLPVGIGSIVGILKYLLKH
jgi:GT2 family glycosyltransferase